jgi:hypothetical protein
MTDKTQPEALRLAEILEGDYCPDWFYEQGVDEVAAELRRQHTRIAELEAQLEAVGAGGVQALSAAPAGFVPVSAFDRLHAHAESLAARLLAAEQAAPKAAPKSFLDGADVQDESGVLAYYSREAVLACINAALESVAAPKAAPGESDYSKKWDAELGRTAMRFVDRAGDVHPGIDDAETICAEFYKAMSEVIERMPHVQRMTPRKAAPGEQNTVPAEWLEQAYREGWAACRDAETIGEEAEDWAFGNSTANSRMIDAQQAAPRQEA